MQRINSSQGSVYPFLYDGRWKNDIKDFKSHQLSFFLLQYLFKNNVIQYASPIG